MLCNNKSINTEVSIDYPLAQSQQGRYFIGQTPTLIGQTSNTMAALVNPINSNVNIYLNAITVTNISGEPLTSQIYLRTTPPIGSISPYVSCTNVTIVPPPQPYGQVQYNDTSTGAPANGIPIFTRIVPGFSTTVIDGGQIIIPPNSCVLVYIPNLQADSAIVAFGWWEDPITRCYCDASLCYK